MRTQWLVSYAVCFVHGTTTAGKTLFTLEDGYKTVRPNSTTTALCPTTKTQYNYVI